MKMLSLCRSLGVATQKISAQCDNDRIYNHPVFLLIFPQIFTKQESTPPAPIHRGGGETFAALFQNFIIF
jgi:hypothetical protein